MQSQCSGLPEKNIRESIRDIFLSHFTYDEVEKVHARMAIDWIDSGAQLFRQNAPNVPPMHLVSYAVLFDAKQRSFLLVDHKKSSLWLPPGGHVEEGEHPLQAAKREAEEELGFKAAEESIGECPFFLSVTQTVGTCTPLHTDVTLWYLFLCDESAAEFIYTHNEFEGISWVPLWKLDSIPTDPNMGRFSKKLQKVFIEI